MIFLALVSQDHIVAGRCGLFFPEFRPGWRLESIILLQISSKWGGEVVKDFW